MQTPQTKTYKTTISDLAEDLQEDTFWLHLWA